MSNDDDKRGDDLGGVSFNIQGNVSQAAAKIEQGDVGHIGDVYHGQQPITESDIDKLFDAVRQALADYDIPGFELAEINTQVVDPLNTLAKEAQGSQSVEPSLLEKASALLERLKPYSGKITESLLVFSESILLSFAASNPVVAGLLSVLKVLKV